MRKYFVCLDELWANREPHPTEVAMFKAPSLLVEMLALPRTEAMEATSAWMMTFSPDKSLDERVALGARRGPTLAENTPSASLAPRTSSPQAPSFPYTLALNFAASQ